MEAACGETPAILKPRAYQLEMLEDSLRKNIIVAMDTGSGKTNIAILRMRAELEKCGSRKRVWFLCPTVALAEQQYRVISGQLPVFQCRILSGNDGIDKWKSQSLWDAALLNISIVVCTHQVLLDALVHGFVRLTSIALLVFDEAHHCQSGHAANKIMQRFYHPTKAQGGEIPHVLGLTASPVVNAKGDGLQIIEENLDAISRTPKLNREELMRHVRLPELVPLFYEDSLPAQHPACTGIADMYSFLRANEANDPYVVYLRAAGSAINPKKLNKALSGKTFCQEQTKKLVTIATEIRLELGTWAAVYYLRACISKFQKDHLKLGPTVDDLGRQEYDYIRSNFAKFVPIGNLDEEPKAEDLSSKLNLLVETLATEMNGNSSAIIFVKTRASVWLLKHILQVDSRTTHMLRIGTFVGTSSHANRMENISNLVDMKGQDDSLEGLRNGTKNVIISTSICEEGLDISACNMVICFERPPNLKSFIQRRGRARSVKSQYFVMLPARETTQLENWHSLEKYMKERYMDDLRELQELERLESEEEGYREFVVPSTGAKLFLDDAVRHLYHFCSTMPGDRAYTAPEPIFIFRVDGVERIICRVLLPMSVDSSLREFESASTWKTERMARSDAAFEAYIGLYRAQLIDDNLMPIEIVDVEMQHVFSELQARPNVLTVSGQLDPWPLIANKWQSNTFLYSHPTIIHISDSSTIRMNLVCSDDLSKIPGLKLYIDEYTTAEATLMDAFPQELPLERGEAAEITYTILNSGLWSRMDKLRRSFPILCVPPLAYEQHGWLSEVSGAADASEISSESWSSEAVGLLHDSNYPNTSFVCHGTQQVYDEEASSTQSPNLKIRGKKFTKRRNFLSRFESGAVTKGAGITLHDAKDCSVDRLPVQYSWFSIFFPSILHHIGSFYVAKHLCETVLKPVDFSNPNLVRTALTASAAGEPFDYQRLEFLGDSLLKYHTSLTLMSTHSRWHEGILSRAKDHIVSNGNLAAATHARGLSKYILTERLTWHGWRMPYNEDLRARTESKNRELSTKTLADVAEALVGAAYLDGGESKALRFLATILPSRAWPPTDSCYESLYNSPPALEVNRIPDQYESLEALLGYEFSNKSLLLESITHVSYVSTSGIACYQRLEYLGDAILDSIVTKMVFGHSSKISVSRMHSLRSTTVNANFLAFFAMSLTIAVESMEIVPSDTDSEPTTRSSNRRLSLPLFLRAGPIPQLAANIQKTCKRHELLQESVREKLDHGAKYPWAELSSLNAEKIVSDLVESALGAIAIDSGGDMASCERWLEKLGVLPWLRQAMDREIDLLHPKEGLGIAADTLSVEYKTTIVEYSQPVTDAEVKETELRYQTAVFVGDREVCKALGINQLDAETRAADQALAILKVEKQQSEVTASGELPGASDESSSSSDEFFDAEEAKPT